MYLRKGTQKRILETLKGEGELPVRILARRLDRTAEAIRRHLGKCVTAGVVSVRPQRRKAGRPLLLYSLTERGSAMFGQRLESTALEILAQAEAIGGSALVTEILTRRQAAINQPCRERAKGKSLPDRVRVVTQQLNADGYLSDTESDNGSGIRLRIHHCPVPALARAYPELCRLEYESLCSIVGPDASVSVLSNMSGGDSCCLYLIEANGSAESSSPSAP